MQITTNRFSFVSASLALMVTYVTSAVPIPLYGTYQLYDHVSYWQLSLSSVVYFIGAVTALVLLGRLSNHWGRKPVALLSLMLAALSVAVFVNVHSAPPLIVGRLLQGLSCGLASTTLASWLVDHARSVPSWIPAAVVSCGPMTGLTLGGGGSGLCVNHGAQFCWCIIGRTNDCGQSAVYRDADVQCVCGWCTARFAARRFNWLSDCKHLCGHCTRHGTHRQHRNNGERLTTRRAGQRLCRHLFHILRGCRDTDAYLWPALFPLQLATNRERLWFARSVRFGHRINQSTDKEPTANLS